MTDTLWRPTASLNTLQTQAQLRQCVREYMQSQQVLEVNTPALSQAATTDPNIHSFKTSAGYLHTSPEFPMKRLIAAYQRDIYQMANVFRDDEQGRHHNAEFVLLEWYRMGMDHHALMQDMAALLLNCWQLTAKPWHEPHTLSYVEQVSSLCGMPFTTITVNVIEQYFAEHQRSYPKAIGKDLNAALDLFMDEFVIRHLPTDRATFICDYPASQAALARTGSNTNGTPVAERFELYWGALELANGFHELSDANEQRRRFKAEQAKRREAGLDELVIDEHLLSALESGFPDCAGVALGMDRLCMLIADVSHIKDVIAFPSDRA